MKHIQLRIEKPCSEDWSKMNPTEKGAFCSSCQKEVLDLTGKSFTDAYQKLKATKNACAKLPAAYLNTPVTLFSTKKRIQLSFVLCIFLFFSSTLTSCSETNDLPAMQQTEESVTAKDKLTKLQKTVIDTVQQVVKLSHKAKNNIAKGKVDAEIGESIIQPQFIGDTVAVEDSTSHLPIDTSIDTILLNEYDHVVGGISFVHTQKETLIEEPIQPPFEYTPNLFPNPTQRSFQIKMETQENDNIYIAIYNIQGQLIEHRSIDPQPSLLQEYFDIEKQGVYLATIVINDTERITKRVIVK